MKKIVFLILLLTLTLATSVCCYADEVTTDENKSVDSSDDNDDSSTDVEHLYAIIDDVKARLEELNISNEMFQEKFDYYDLLTQDINSNLVILIAQNEDLDSKLHSIFYDSDEHNYLDNIYINQNHYVENSEDVKNFLYAGHIKDGEEIDFSETLAYKLDEMEKGITDSLTVTNEKTLTELNTTLTTTNTFLSYLFVIFLIIICLGIACLIGWVIHKILSRNIY